MLILDTGSVLELGEDVANSAGLNVTLGYDWFYAFMGRNNLTVRKPVPLAVLRAKGCNEPALLKYFTDLKLSIEKLFFNSTMTINDKC